MHMVAGKIRHDLSKKQDIWVVQNFVETEFNQRLGQHPCTTPTGTTTNMHLYTCTSMEIHSPSRFDERLSLWLMEEKQATGEKYEVALTYI